MWEFEQWTDAEVAALLLATEWSEPRSGTPAWDRWREVYARVFRDSVRRNKRFIPF